ncbi:MAG: hypothetical protein D6679_07695 [Candidatus Hydrogenedentota bacterium]|nr:MAG: hypothetical protein D6679_07695 [Candidatus Hydrogenedentota bacterium]
MTLVGSCRLRLGNDTGAVEIFTRYVRHHPFDALGYFSLGVAYQSLQNRRKAVENYWAALLIDPNMEPARVNLRQLGAL